MISQRAALGRFAQPKIRNWNDIETGELRVCAEIDLHSPAVDYRFRCWRRAAISAMSKFSAAASASVKRRRAVFLLSLGVRLEANARNVNELDQRKVSPAGERKRAPIGVIADIAAGVARQARRHSACSRRREQTGEGRAAAARRRFSQSNDAARRPVSAHIWKQYRARVARLRFDTKMPPAGGEPEHQNNVGLSANNFGSSLSTAA
jgi:hypothetical protein